MPDYLNFISSDADCLLQKKITSDKTGLSDANH